MAGPQERSLTYTEITQIVGSLYLDSYRRVAALEEQLAAIVKSNEDLSRQNTVLKTELEKQA